MLRLALTLIGLWSIALLGGLHSPSERTSEPLQPQRLTHLINEGAQHAIVPTRVVVHLFDTQPDHLRSRVFFAALLATQRALTVEFHALELRTIGWPLPAAHLLQLATPIRGPPARTLT